MIRDPVAVAAKVGALVASSRAAAEAQTKRFFLAKNMVTLLKFQTPCKLPGLAPCENLFAAGMESL
jgi:hypothetical protein